MTASTMITAYSELITPSCLKYVYIQASELQGSRMNPARAKSDEGNAWNQSVKTQANAKTTRGPKNSSKAMRQQPGILERSYHGRALERRPRTSRAPAEWHQRSTAGPRSPRRARAPSA